MSKAPPSSIPRQIGRFRLTAQLGSGGLGKVFQGEDEAGQQVAIKVLTNRTERSRARFQRELELGRTLDHPNLVGTLEGGQVQGHPYLVLELVRGEDLSQRLRRGGPLPAPELLDLARQLASGLSYLHARGLVHRDLKPENLRLTPEGRLKILDLGLMHAPDTTAITATGTVLGTFLYMSPEQLKGGEKSPSMDLYAVAVLLYKLSTGRHPLYGEGSISLSDYLPLPARGEVLPWRPGETTALDPFFRRGLAPDPAARWQSAEALAHGFASALAAEGLVERQGSDTSEDTSEDTQLLPAGAGTISSADITPRPPTPPRRGGRRAVAALGALGLAAAGTWWMMPSPPPALRTVEGLALSPDHRILVLESDRATRLRLGAGGPEVPRSGDGSRHFVPVAPDQDDLRLSTEDGASLPPRSLSGQAWEPVTWNVDGSLSWEGATIPLPRPGELGPWSEELPSPEEMLEDLAQGVLLLDVPEWIFEAQETGRRPGRLGDLLVASGLATLQANTAEILAARLGSIATLPLEDLRLWYLAHDLCLAEAYLHRSGVPPPVAPLAQGLYARLLAAEDYSAEGRPPPAPGRQTYAKNDDFFLPELPGKRGRDPIESLWYVPKEPAVLEVPAGTAPVHLEAVLSWATVFAHGYYGRIEIEGTRPIYFYEDPTAPGGQVPREAADQEAAKLRRRYRVRIPQALIQGSPLSIQVDFRPWTWEAETAYQHVIMQAFGWTRDLDRP